MTSASHLPLHPTKRHPHTGEPLRAIFVSVKTGRVFWPIIGAAEGDPPEGETPEAKAARETAEAAAAEAAKKGDGKGGNDDPPKQKANDAGNAIDDQGRDLGYPVNTAVKDMKPEQQAAYHSAQSRKHEGRNREWLGMFDGKKPEEVKAELDTLRREKMTEAERRVEDAKRGGATEASKKAARGMLELALDHVDEDRRTILLSTTDVTSVINENGDIDTAKVKSLAHALAPVKGGDGADLGQGRRGSHSGGGIQAGKSLFEERRGKKSSTSTES